MERSTLRILDLLDEHDTKGTFYVLGWVADKLPGLVKEIDRRGHELGSHSYWHRLVYEQTPAQFRSDLRRSIRVLEDACGKQVRCYRAPSFSITRRSLWALEILVEEGIEIDSSIFPTHHDRYGIPDAQREIHQIETPAGSLTEFPPSVFRMGKVNVPISGGGYFRAKPYGVYRRLVRRAMAKSGQPLMFYIHPWEVDDDQPRMEIRSPVSRLRHYLNLHRTEDKLSRLLEDVRFATVSGVVAERFDGIPDSATALSIA
ncbi:MAG: DUF3473 domain-containing protein [Candidatus Zixiibacteriota bacterium]|nr:MAG: DUF3473 domain-containing protein [candidate division Zixibacteria bacterium]